MTPVTIHGEGSIRGVIGAFLEARYADATLLGEAVCTACGLRIGLEQRAGAGEPPCPRCDEGRMVYSPWEFVGFRFDEVSS